MYFHTNSSGAEPRRAMSTGWTYCITPSRDREQVAGRERPRRAMSTGLTYYISPSPDMSQPIFIDYIPTTPDKASLVVGGFLRNNLSNSKQASIRHSDVRLLMDRHAYLFGLRTVETQCTRTVRIIAPSQIDGKEGFRLLCKLELNQLLRLKSISAFLA